MFICIGFIAALYLFCLFDLICSYFTVCVMMQYSYLHFYSYLYFVCLCVCLFALLCLYCVCVYVCLFVYPPAHSGSLSIPTVNCLCLYLYVNSDINSSYAKIFNIRSFRLIGLVIFYRKKPKRAQKAWHPIQK